MDNSAPTVEQLIETHRQLAGLNAAPSTEMDPLLGGIKEEVPDEPVEPGVLSWVQRSEAMETEGECNNEDRDANDLEEAAIPDRHYEVAIINPPQYTPTPDEAKEAYLDFFKGLRYDYALLQGQRKETFRNALSQLLDE